MKNLRDEIVLDLSECIKYVERTGFIFLPHFEKTIVKVELFQEKAKSQTINNLTAMLKGSLFDYSYPEIKVTENWLNDLKKLLHFVENVVPQLPEN